MLQIGDPYIQFVIDTRKVDPTKLKPYLEDPTKLKYGVNLKFDAAHLLAS